MRRLTNQSVTLNALVEFNLNELGSYAVYLLDFVSAGK